ncbi:thioredoxin family protein [Methermicoccus shengliensis]|uniref:Thioredoxin n=1 Tax=Methermicoccus shengliensis TaxID=660064 RepID=A0A832RXR0_9EURY|nr:thioredoxin family protein [Methermicoccus shengliensis]KUK04323.1 MAG: Redox-active disulfide protein 2 [Euryarchaeota archaeon 55_53]KUK30666.1 MAG: Redox-active disulfide protein 2 [Methanosarcinales archeaon 56_1174]MDN5295490.1 hypothetical protein [Methanosarcinales archaeon]HIH70254.1 thioredoxin family protein [Methermicoccus shengliensis]
MKIEILGTGCPKCQALTKYVERAVEELGLKAEVVKVDSIEDILEYGVMSTPALAIEGKVLFAGKLPSYEEVYRLIDEHAGGGKDDGRA